MVLSVYKLYVFPGYCGGYMMPVWPVMGVALDVLAEAPAGTLLWMFREHSHGVIDAQFSSDGCLGYLVF